MSNPTLSKHILEKETYTKSSLTQRPRLPSLGKQNNLSFQQQATHTHPSCQNHRDRPSLFRIETEGVPLFYCERCAILLASQGFSVEKVLGREENRGKGSERRCRDVLERLNARRQELKGGIHRVEEYYERIRVNLGIYFESIIESIARKKEQFQQFISKKEGEARQESEKQLLKIERVVKEYSRAKVLNSDSSRLWEKMSVDRRGQEVESMLREMRVLEMQGRGRGGLVVRDIVTIDVNSVIQVINDSLKIKVDSAEETLQKEDNPSSARDLYRQYSSREHSRQYNSREYSRDYSRQLHPRQETSRQYQPFTL